VNFVIKNVNIVNEGEIFQGVVYTRNEKIERIARNHEDIAPQSPFAVIDGSGKYLMPGIIDDQVHFRDPGLTYKADIYSESKAAVAGGVTSFMDMPNTIPQTITQELLEKKYQFAALHSLANFSFYMGASNDNIDEIVKTDPLSVCGVKVFMGASTGNMLVNDPDALRLIFSLSPVLVAVHCEDEVIIQSNLKAYKEKYGEGITVNMHPLIRSEEACYKSSSSAIELAEKYNTRLHILHISTAKELELFNNSIPLAEKKITSEVCIHHLWFDESDYKRSGSFIKWNPAIKTRHDKESLLKAVLSNTIDVIATDHAPHTIEEKKNPYLQSPSGGPMVQHSLVAMLELNHKGMISLEHIVQKMCHSPAELFKINKRGYIREGYFADLVLVDMNDPWTVSKDNILYKCAWSPFEGTRFRSKITHTFVNGNMVYFNGYFDEEHKGKRLIFNRNV